MDCFGVCNGTAQLDCEDECGGKATVDCAGDCRGDAFISNCTNECVGGTTRKPVTAGRDVCGMCTLDIGYESPLDCANVCFGTAVVDECGECSGEKCINDITIVSLTFDKQHTHIHKKKYTKYKKLFCLLFVYSVMIM